MLNRYWYQTVGPQILALSLTSYAVLQINHSLSLNRDNDNSTHTLESRYDNYKVHIKNLKITKSTVKLQTYVVAEVAAAVAVGRNNNVEDEDDEDDDNNLIKLGIIFGRKL